MLFNYPKQAAVGRILPKNKLYANAKISAALKKKFVDRIDKIVWEYKLSPETINVSGKTNAPEIEIFRIELRQPELSVDILQTIDNAIPFPIIFEIVFGNQIKTKAAFKRPSEADSAKWVTEIYFETDWQNVDKPRQDLPTALNLEVLYEKILGSLMSIPKNDGEDLHDYIKRITIIRQKEAEILKLESKIKKEKQFNRKVELNTELRKLKNEILHHRDTEVTEFFDKL